MDILEFWQTPKYYKEPSRACTVNNLTKCFTKISERLMPIIAKKTINGTLSTVNGTLSTVNGTLSTINGTLSTVNVINKIEIFNYR